MAIIVEVSGLYTWPKSQLSPPNPLTYEGLQLNEITSTPSLPGMCLYYGSRLRSLAISADYRRAAIKQLNAIEIVLRAKFSSAESNTTYWQAWSDAKGEFLDLRAGKINSDVLDTLRDLFHDKAPLRKLSLSPQLIWRLLPLFPHLKAIVWSVQGVENLLPLCALLDARAVVDIASPQHPNLKVKLPTQSWWKEKMKPPKKVGFL